MLNTRSSNLTLEAEKSLWWIPITYTSKTRLNFNETKPSHWMKAQQSLVIEDGLPLSDWIIVNLQQTGYFRVNYDVNNWKLIQRHLNDEKRFTEIVPPNRAQIIVCVYSIIIQFFLLYQHFYRTMH